MDAAESAVRHQHDEVARPRLGRDGADDVVDRPDVTRAASGALEIRHELIGRQTFRLGQRGSEHAGNHHLVGGAECAGEIVLEHAPARRRRARLEHRPQLATRVAGLEGEQRLVHGGGMVREIVEDGHAPPFADDLEPPLDPL
jgi:hypothetical protein